MTPEVDKTYIEKAQYWERNRVVVVRAIKGDKVHCTVLNLENWQRSATRIDIHEFKQRYELCEIQMSMYAKGCYDT